MCVFVYVFMCVCPWVCVCVGVCPCGCVCSCVCPPLALAAPGVCAACESRLALSAIPASGRMEGHGSPLH